jgi:chaperonin cofactor prefoldin
VRDKIIAVAKETVLSDRARKIADQTGALIYWEDADAAKKQIEKDKKTLETIGKALDQ